MSLAVQKSQERHTSLDIWRAAMTPVQIKPMRKLSVSALSLAKLPTIRAQPFAKDPPDHYLASATHGQG